MPMNLRLANAIHLQTTNHGAEQSSEMSGCELNHGARGRSVWRCGAVCGVMLLGPTLITITAHQLGKREIDVSVCWQRRAAV